MKRFLAICLGFVLVLSGCAFEDDAIDGGLRLRSAILSSSGCSFQAGVTADYGDKLYSFCVDCVTDQSGKLTFQVTEPETISGISGFISQGRSALTFDDEVLAFPQLTEDNISPVCAPWILINSLKSGYLTACGETENGYMLLLNDSYEEEALQLEVYIDFDLKPTYCEILWKGRRVLSMKITNFKIL